MNKKQFLDWTVEQANKNRPTDIDLREAEERRYGRNTKIRNQPEQTQEIRRQEGKEK